MEENLGFSLSEVSRLMRRRFDQLAREIGVTRAQWRTLAVLLRHEGINQGGLAERLEIEPITACRMIDRLEEAGHVERRRDPADRRMWRIYVTDAARPLVEQLAVIGAQVKDEALTGVAAAEQEMLGALLQRMRANLSAGGEAPEPEAAHG